MMPAHDRTSGKEFSKQILSWAEVNQTHRVRTGIYHRNDRLISLLTDFGRINPCYPDKETENGNRIIYTGEGRRGDQGLTPGNRAMLAAIKTQHAVPLFNKLATGRWQHFGFWRVTVAEHRFDAEENRMLWRFTLERAKKEGKSEKPKGKTENKARASI